MRICRNRSISLLISGLLLSTGAVAHPYDSPLEFRLHRTEDGRPIYSNIPKKCFRNGRLICHGLNPVFPTPMSTLPAHSQASE